MGGPVGGEEKICAGRKWSGGVFLNQLLLLLLLQDQICGNRGAGSLAQR